ncbi:MAG: MgtC/SapB family protein [Dongiaceae bacterium]
MEEAELFRRLGIALAIGLLIGLERGWQSRGAAEGSRTAGLRTYALSGLLGGVSAALAEATDMLLLAAGLVTFAGAFTWFSWHEAQAKNEFSVTGVVAALLTFTLGAYAVLGDANVAVAGAVAMVLLLALKSTLHGWMKNITWLEFRAVLILLAMGFLLLPVLPNRTVDPWDTLNPAAIWLLAIMIAGLSFAGYVAIRVIGDKAGIVIAALAGGLTSSTATTLSLARWAKGHEGATPLLAGGILLAGLVMVIRIVVIAGALNQALIISLALPLGAAGLVLLAGGLLLILRRPAADKEQPKLDLKNPFDLGTALKLTALIAVITLLSKLAATTLGTGGVFALAAVSGLADVDALTLSMARLGGSQIAAEDATAAILLAAAVNTISKAAMAAWVGGRRLGLQVGVVSAIAVAAIGAVHLVYRVV